MTTESKERTPPSARTSGGDGTEPGGATTDTPEPGETLTAPLEENPEAMGRMSIHERMLAVLSQLPAIGKDQRNTQQDFMFRGHDDILNALNPLLSKWGVYVVPNVLERTVAHRTTQRGSTMYEVNLHVQYAFWGARGDVVYASTWGEGTDSGDKATNKAMTMAFKNVLNQAFAISSAEFKYADADAGTPEETTAGDNSRQAQSKAKDDARKDSLTKRIVAVAVDLDERTSQTAGTWQAAIEEAVQRDYGVPFADLKNEELVEVGKYLKGRVDEGITEMPENLRVQPF